MSFFLKSSDFFRDLIYIIGMAESFWQRAKNLIKSHKISQHDFAVYIGIPPRTFWGWIHRNVIPDASRACLIAEALGVTVEYLVRGTDDDDLNDRQKRTSDRKTAVMEIRKLVKRINEKTKMLG